MTGVQTCALPICPQLRILVLDGGRVAELGTHAQLVEKPGIYRDIYNIQMQSADRALLEEGGSEHGGH